MRTAGGHAALLHAEHERQAVEGGPGRAGDDEGQDGGLGVDAVDGQARAVAEVVHVDGAQVLDEQGRGDPVLEPALLRVDGQQALRHGQAGAGHDRPLVPLDDAGLDALPPLGQAHRGAHQVPDLLGRAAQPDRVAHAAASGGHRVPPVVRSAVSEMVSTDRTSSGPKPRSSVSSW